jgi:hypothetical protein
VNADQIKNISNFVKICCGPHHSLALAVDLDQSDRVIPLNFKDEKHQEDNADKNEDHHEITRTTRNTWSSSGATLGSQGRPWQFRESVHTKDDSDQVQQNDEKLKKYCEQYEVQPLRSNIS